MSTSLADDVARKRIAEDLDATLFVEAGAGSGKTGSLVTRVVSTVLHGGVPLRSVAAVTFTEKAAAELRDRLRAAFESAARDKARPKVECEAARTALDDLDAAAIGTLHSFAQRILGEHPVEAGLPPLVEVSDELSSQVSFEQRWLTLRRALLEEHDLRRPLLLAVASGVTFEHLRSIAKTFNGEWDRLDETVLAGGPPSHPEPVLAEVHRCVELALAQREQCTAKTDKMLDRLAAVTAWRADLAAATDDEQRLEVLERAGKLSNQHGKQAAWTVPLAEVRACIADVRDAAAAERRRFLDRVLRRLAHRIALGTIDAARERQREGQVEFHDLLVLSREVLRSPVHGAEVRQRLHERYQRLLLDEFQDTDPIQIELAVRIAGGAAADADDWRSVVVPPGRLFVVGDPKQSIYRFRRADISTYLEAQHRIGEDLELTTNFRTTPTVLAWVNDVFSTLIRPVPASQPPYHRLDAHREGAPGGTRVLLTGVDAHPDDFSAGDVREQEALDVAGVIRTALSEGWRVQDKVTQDWRTVRLDDIAVLVPARTSLPQLEDALDKAGIPFRAEASSLVYRTPEVRDLLMTAQAVDDPSDALSLVAALRSPLFGCGDDDLWTWKRGGGSFNLLAPPPEAIPEDHPVRLAIAWLRQLQKRSRWAAPSEVLDDIVRARRMMETGATGPRARDVWRRLRFVVDQARAWSEAQAGGLRDYLAWAYRQGDESARVAEAVLPETDANSVRVLTIHAAKGLEFPVVIVSGMSTLPQSSRRGVQVLWPATGGYELKLTKELQTGDFELAKPIDEQMGHHERLRLLYVACTRARDHLVVSLHRAERKNPASDESKLSSSELLFEPARHGTGAVPYTSPQDLVPLVGVQETPRPAPSWDAWTARVDPARQASRLRSTVSASSVEGTPVDVQPEPGLDKAPRDLELPPWNKGRYGTAVGRAVHGALQTVDLRTRAGLVEAVDAQCLAEGVVPYADEVLAICRAALDSPIVRQAAARRHWRETYVGTTLDDGTVLEGYVDLVFKGDDGSLVIVDYKTDSVPDAALPARVAVYLPQMAAYARALGQATCKTVNSTVLLFVGPGSARQRVLTAKEWAAAPPLEASLEVDVQG